MTSNILHVTVCSNEFSVQIGKDYPPKKSPTNLANFINACWPFYKMLEKHLDGFKDMTLDDQALVIEKLTLPYWTKLKEYQPNAFGEKWYNFTTFRSGAPLLAEIFNSFIRLWVTYRKKKSKLTFFRSMNGTSLEEYAEKILPRFLDQIEPSKNLKKEAYWANANGSFGGKLGDLKKLGKDGATADLWNQLSPSGVDKVWAAALNTLQNHTAKVKYNTKERAASKG